MKITLKLFVAIAAIIGFAFAGCQAPAGPQGDRGLPGDQGPARPAPELEIQIDGEDATELTLFLGDSRTLVPIVSGDAVVRTVLWELYDDAAGQIISLDREPSSRFPMLTGGNVVVTGLADGEAKIRVSALGSGDIPIQKHVAVTVEGITRRLEALANRVDDPGQTEALYLYGSERFAPMTLYFGGTAVGIALRSHTPDVTLYLDGPGPMFTVGAGVTLTLEGVALHGMPSGAANDDAMVRVNGGGVLIMERGSRIAGNFNPTPAATVANQGGGVHVAAGGTFTMFDGEIHDNIVFGHGGGVFNLGTFDMRGGEIRDNATISALAGNTGGGVHNRNVFNMHGGKIVGNSSNALLPHNALGGGVFNQGAFDMHDGEIQGNEAGQGGGVINVGLFTMRGGTISDNSVYSVHADTPHNALGGGVLNRDVWIMYDGEISGNSATGAGGGVFNDDIFRMHDGRIFGNTATSGGGVENLGVFGMIDGAIYGIDYEEGGNAVSSSFAALRTGVNGTSQHGTFDNVFVSRGDLPSTDLTLRVTGGDLVIPTMEGTLAMQLAWLRTFAGRAGSTYEYEIIVRGDETINPTVADSGAGQTLPTGRTLTITVAGDVQSDISVSGNGNVFRVPFGVTLILGDNITLRGRNVNNLIHLVRVNNGGTLIMNAGSRVTGNVNTSMLETAGGGGVFVNNGGAFVLNGGEIAGNRTTSAILDGGHGGGVRVHSGGRFIMLGGRIYGNHAARDGGGVFVAGGANPGVFHMSGGVIYGDNATVSPEENRNTAGSFGASLSSGAGITLHGAFDDPFDGGTVASLGEFSEAGVLRITNTTIMVEAGVLQDTGGQPYGGSVVEQLDWLLESAVDGGNYVIYVNDDEFVAHVPFPQSRLPTGRSGVTVVLYNTGDEARHVGLPTTGTIPTNQGILFSVPDGVTLVVGENVTLVGRGGPTQALQNGNALVRVNSGGTLILDAGSRVTGNVVNSTQSNNAAGAGVWVNGGGTLVLNGGEISGNATAGSGTSLHGAGVRVESGGRFYMLGGEIFDNNIRPVSSNSDGGGVWVAAGGTLRVSDGIVHGIDADGIVGNAASNNGASLFIVSGGAAEYGAFGEPFEGTVASLGVFERAGDLRTSSLTIHVEDGAFRAPERRGGLVTQLTWLREFAEDGEAYTITLNGDETLVPTVADTGANQTLPTGRNLTITLEGDAPSRVSLAANGNLFRVPSGVVLELGNNVTLVGRSEGGNGDANNSTHLVRVIAGGVLRMNEGSMVTGNTNTSSGVNAGGGVYVAAGGAFVLDGGVVSGNVTTGTDDLGNGGGVRVGAGGAFDMLGGAISDNESQFGGGVFVATGGLFRIYAGIIHGSEEPASFANVSRGGLGSSLKNLGATQFGAFVGDAFNRAGDLGTNNGTIAVTNGVFARPDEPPATAPLAERLDWLRAFGQDDEIVIVLQQDEYLTPAQATLPAGRTITISGGGHGIGLAENGNLFAIIHGTTLILEDVTLEGRAAAANGANNHSPLILVNGGVLRMNDGARIGGNTNTLVPGLPAWWVGGGGVHVAADGIFDMRGGEISGNATTGANLGAAGVHIALYGTFNMHGGVIRDNEVGSAAGNVATSHGAGGVRVAGVFNMYGGEVSGNRTIATSGLSAGGVLVAAGGTFDMRGGGITGNVANGPNGAGGVVVAFDTNIPRRPAGVFNMHGGTISGNSATVLSGQTAGGVRVSNAADGTVPTFNMRGGTISGNRAYSIASNASGGVCVLGGGFFRISDGLIHGGNEAPPNIATTGPHALFRATAATGAQFGTFDGDGGAFVRVGDLDNGDLTIEVRGGELIRP